MARCRDALVRRPKVDETAVVIKISPVTVRRDWSVAKIWLYRELTDQGLLNVNN